MKFLRNRNFVIANSNFKEIRDADLEGNIPERIDVSSIIEYFLSWLEV